MRLIPITSHLLLITLSLSAQVAQLRWDIQVDRPVPHDVPVWQGETVDLMPRLVQGTAPVAVTNAPVEFRYREAALATNVYRYVTAEPNTNTGVLAVRWIPDYDAGAAWYDYQIIVGSNAANPRAFGRITMRPTIGWQASTSPPPAILQYATTAQMQAASNALADALHVAVASIETLASHWPPDATPAQYFSYVTNESGGLNVTGYDTAGGLAVNVPEYIYGLPVETLWSYSFASNSVSSVSGGGRLWGIGPKAFQRCYSLESIDLPTVSYIGSMSFEICTNLYDVILPGTGQVVGSAFLGCTRLDYVDLGAVTSILSKAFSNCTNLRAVWFSGNAPAVGSLIYESIPANQVTNYVRSANATGWGASLGGMPVSLAPIAASTATVGGVGVATVQDLAESTNALVQTYLLTTNAWMSVSNSVLSVTVVTNGVTNVVWSSAESAGGLDPSFSNAVVSAITDLTSRLAGKAPLAWGQYAPDGSANPDPDYMLFLNSPATWFAGGCSWISSGAYAALSTSGTVAFEACGDGQFRIGPNSTNWFGYVQGGSVLVGAAADSLSVTEGGTSNGYVEIVYPYVSGDFPALWFTPQLGLDFALLETNSVAWADNLDGSATVTAPATTATGFWYATTTATFDNYFQSTMPAKFAGGVLGATNAAPVVYDSTVIISSGGKSYRIPAQEVLE